MKLIQRFNILFFFVLLVGLQACEDEYKRIDYAKLTAEENALLQKYLTDTVRFGDPKGEIMPRLDSLTKAAIDTVDYYKDKGGIIYFNQKMGIGEPVKAGKLIGYRYKRFPIILDSKGVAIKFAKKPRFPENNYDDLEPAFAYAGQVNASTGYYTGLNDAIMLMHLFGKSIVILPSTSGDNGFVSYVYELEVVYIEK